MADVTVAAFGEGKRATVGAWRSWVPAAMALGTVAAAGAAFQRVFGWGNVAGSLALGVVVGGAAGGLGHVLARAALVPEGRVRMGEWHPEPAAAERRTSGPGALLAAILVVAAAAGAAVVDAVALATPAGSAGDGLQAVVDGWDRILTTAVPVPPTPDRLPLVAALVAVAGSLAVLAAFRDRPGLVPLFPGGALLLAALVLGVGGPGALGTVVAPPAVLAGGYLLVVSRPAGEGVAWLPPRRIAAAAVTGAVVLTVVVAVGDRFPLATVRSPVDLRQSLSRPVDLGNAPNLLDQLPAVRAMGSTPMFDARVDATWLADPMPWQLATLDTYNGAGWGTDARAVKVGNVLPVAAASPGPTAHVQVHVSDLSAPWVPTTGVPVSVAPADLSYDPTSQILVDSGLRQGRTYSLGAVLSAPSLTALDSAGIPDTPAVVGLTRVPSCFAALAGPLRQLAASAVTNLARPVQQATAIETALRAGHGYTLDDNQASDVTCGGLAKLARTKVGTTEDFASAFALMARSVGLPTRLAVGFRPGVPTGARSVTVRGGDATVWPEVDFAKIGWVAFSPFPTATGQGNGLAKLPQTHQSPSGINRVRQTIAGGASTTAPPVATTVAPATRRPGGGPGGLWWWLARACRAGGCRRGCRCRPSGRRAAAEIAATPGARSRRSGGGRLAGGPRPAGRLGQPGGRAHPRRSGRGGRPAGAGQPDAGRPGGPGRRRGCLRRRARRGAASAGRRRLAGERRGPGRAGRGHPRRLARPPGARRLREPRPARSWAVTVGGCCSRCGCTRRSRSGCSSRRRWCRWRSSSRRWERG